MIGNSILNYRIIQKLGYGGVGKVYRAENRNLNRNIAIKLLPEIFGSDHERLARLDREAELRASLNHTDIAFVAQRLEIISLRLYEKH